MKFFLKCLGSIILLVTLFKAAQAEIGLSPAAENAIAAGSLEQALYRLMALPAGSILVRRPPSEARPELDSLIQKTPNSSELYAVRAQEDERQLDFKAAERDWRQALAVARDKRHALIDLADFYQRRLQPEQEVDVLLQAAALPAQAEDQFKAVAQQSAWIAFGRALRVLSESKLAPAIRTRIYEAWVIRYPKESIPLREYFRALIDAKDIPAARNVAERIHSAFPNEPFLGVETDAQLARAQNGDEAALAVYAKQFSPLWPAALRTNYFNLLTESHQLRAFLAKAHNQSTSSPTDLDPALRAFFYYDQQAKRDLAGQQLLELEARRTGGNIPWTAAELKTVGALFARLADYDEAAHAYYSLYSLPGVAPTDKSFAMASLIDLLLDVPEQPLQFGSRDLSIYRNVATLDRHPGFLNGILSLVLNTTMPDDQYRTASQASVAYFHRAMAARLIERMKSEFPNSRLTPSLESKLFSAYSVYGQNEAILRLAPPWLIAHKTSPDYTKVALLLAATYGATGKSSQELAIYDGLLQKLAEASGHRPLGDVVGGPQSEGAGAARSPDYSKVLDLYISRLTQLKRLPDAIAIYRREIDRNPDDPGIYERLALFVEQNHFDPELEQTYRAAMKRFEGTAWADKLARFYIKKRQSDAYQALAKEVTEKFDGSDLAKFISAARPGTAFSELVYRQVNLYAHQRFPHNLTFVRNLLASYQSRTYGDVAAYEALLRENWYYDANLRTEFFAYLSRTNKLQAELAALPKPEDAAQQKNTAALLEYGEGKAWLADFEASTPAFESLSALVPGDQALATRTISIERSMAYSNSAAFDKAIRFAERKATAMPGDATAATLVGEIYADKELFPKAAPWWNKLANMRPGVGEGYLDSATVFWDYYQFVDSLRLIQKGRAAMGKPDLFAYEAGAIHENQNDYHGAIDEYLKSVLASRPPVAKPPASPRAEGDSGEVEDGEAESAQSEDMSNSPAENRLIVLAKRKQTSTEIEQRTAALAVATPFNPQAFHLRLALLENQERGPDIHSLLQESLNRITEVEQVDLIEKACDRLGYDDLSGLARQRAVALNADSVEKLTARLQLAKFYQTHQSVPQAEREFSSLLKENPNLLGIVRATTDFYWIEKQPKKAVETLEAAASRAQFVYNVQFRREAAQKAADSRDFTTSRRLLDTLLANDPYNGDLLAAKAATYASEGDNTSLLAFYSAQLAQLKNGSFTEDEKTQRTASLRRGYINALLKAKNFDEGLEQYEALLNVYPEDENLPKEIARFAEANHLADRLIKYYEKATSDSPHNYRWPMVLARIDTTLRRYPEAVAALDKAVYVRPDRVDLYLVKADLETRLLRFNNALKTYQKIYEVTYHDSQYLASQASLQARLGNAAEAVRLLKAAYVDAHPKELNGYVEVMSQLKGWRLYKEVDQVFHEVQPLLSRENGNVEQLATLEGQALIALRRPEEAFEGVASVRRASIDPKHPWSLQPQVIALGSAIDNLYTPEEKAAFAVKLETPKALPAEINIYDVARTGGFTEIAVKRLYASAISNPRHSWRALETLQSKRLLDKELANQLEAIEPLLQKESSDGIERSIAAAYARAGDDVNELRMLDRLRTMDVHRYAQLLGQTHADLQSRIRGENPELANQLTQELLPMLPEDQAVQVVQARGANLSSLWTHAYSALTDYFFLSPRTATEFNFALGARTVGAQLKQAKGDALQGAVWYYYAARYGDYLTTQKNQAAVDLMPAVVEVSPAASDSYVALGKDQFELGHFGSAMGAYEQALELSPKRADVHVFMAEGEHAQSHPQESINHLKTAFHLMTVEDQETAKLALTRMNEYRAVKELRPEADAMLAANSKRDGSYQFLPLVEGILTGAADRKSAVNWVLQLAKTPELTGLSDQIIQSSLLSEAEKKPFYLADSDSKKNSLVAYAKYLNQQGESQEAWNVLHQIEPKTDRPADLLLEVAAKSNHLAETLAAYDNEILTPPAGEQTLTVASTFTKSHPDWSLQIREWEYQRELHADTSAASAYFGMAEVRIEQKRTPEALSLLRDVTLSVGAPFENLPPAVSLLEKAGMNKEAAEYAKEWRTAEPWNAEAVFAVARNTQDKTLLETVRKADFADYTLRAQAACRLRDLKAPVSGNTELDLLTHTTITPQEASQPFFVLARLRAGLYAEAIALNPTLRAERLDLAESAFQNNNDALGLAAWNSYEADHSESDQAMRVMELAAGALAKRQQYAMAEALFNRIVPQSARVVKLRDAVRAKARLDAANRSRAPIISIELTQAGIVKPRLTGGAE